MTLEFMEFLENWLMIYVDNMQLKTDTKEEHLVALQQLFLRMRKLNIKCRKEKCIFMVDSIRTMGFVVQHGVIKPDPQKLDMLKKMPEPSTKQQLKAYLGLLQFYRDMLPHLAHTAFQLYAATSENYVFQWTDKLSKYFNLTKTMLEKEVLNTMPLKLGDHFLCHMIGTAISVFFPLMPNVAVSATAYTSAAGSNKQVLGLI
jgi:hypothetical protein